MQQFLPARRQVLALPPLYAGELGRAGDATR
jgi:hypothetical protein